MRHSARAFLAVVVILVLAGGLGWRPAAARADVEADARARYERGQKLYEEGRYDEALAEFSAGYELSHRALFLFNMAECARLGGNLELAKSLYQRYLQEDPRGSLAEVARARLESLGVAPQATSPVEPPEKPTAQPPAAPTGAHPGTAIDLRPGAVAARHEERATSRPRPRPAPIVRRWPFWAAVGAAVVGGAIVLYATRRDDGVPVVDLRP